MPQSINTYISKTGTLRRLLALVRPHKARLAIALAALSAGSIINLLFPEVIRRFMNESYFYYFIEYPWTAAAVLIGLFLLQGVAFYYRSLFFGIIGQEVVNDLRMKMFSSIIGQEIKFFDQAKIGDLVSGLTSDALMIQDAVSNKLSVFIRYSFQVVCGLVLMLLLSPALTGAIVITVPLLIFISRSLGKRLKFWSRQQQSHLGQGAAIAGESFSNARIIHAFNQVEDSKIRFSEALRPVLDAGIKRTKVSAFFTSSISFLMNAALVLLLFYGFQRVSSGALSLGDLTAFVLYGVIVAVSFAFVVNGYSEFIQALSASERVFHFLDKEISTDASPTSVWPGTFTPSISFHNVSFSYPSREGLNVLDDVSLEIRAGEITALVGPSGAGKSTIVNLIMRFYEPAAGSILISGRPITDISAHAVREKVTFVPQEPQLFAVSIAENLRYAKPSATTAELEEVCRKANLWSYILNLPEKLDSQLGERGVNLSSGQKQRLSIARAMLRDPQILILDEATSALDSQNEQLVHEALENLMRGRTTLIIAHRLASVKAADTIYVLTGGKIIQSGNHESLITEGGLYRDLVVRQEITAN